MTQRASLLAVAALVVLTAAAAVQAQGLIEFTGAGAWGTAANWETLPNQDPCGGDPSSRFRDPLDPNLVGTARVPVSTDTAFLRNAVTATLSTGTNIVTGLYVGGREYRIPATQGGTVQARGTSNMVMTGGSLCMTYGSVYVTPGGTLRPAVGNFVVGDYYVGRFTQLGGVISTDSIDIGRKDPSSDPNLVNYGYFRLVDGLITNSGTSTLRIRVGMNDATSVRRFGGDGELVIEGGAMLPPETLATGQKALYIEVAGGTAYPAFRPRGTVRMSGGTIYSENVSIGGKMGDALMYMTGGTITSNDAISVGSSAGSFGTMHMSNGLIDTSTLKAGSGAGADGQSFGIINVTGGTVNAGTISLGRGYAYAEGSFYPGYGTLNVSQADPNVPTLINVDSTSASATIMLGQGDNKKDPNFGPAIGVGVINLYGGSVAVTGASTLDVVLGGDAADVRPGTQARGELNVLGGSFVSMAGVKFTPNAQDVSGVMRVSKGAYCFLNGVLSMNGGTVGAPTLGRSSTLIMEVDGTGNSQVIVNDRPILGDTLRVEGISGYRPKEGNKYVVIHSIFNPYTPPWYTGDFYSFTTNLSDGAQRSDPNDPNSPLLSLWTGMIDPNAPQDYLAIFRGLTSGDANGDHKVDGGDLALMGGAWMQSGQTWGTGNFNGDPNGMVDGGDLALMGGNWMWTKPSGAPGAAELPEPATMALLSLGAVALIRRKRS